jgi:hypothetical protein
VRNSTSHNASIEAAFGPTSAVQPVPHAIKLDVSAGGSKDVTIDMRVERPVPIAAVPPAPFTWTATLDTGGRKPIALSKSFDFVVAHAYHLPQRDKPVVVDGKLDEWGKLAVDVPEASQILGRDQWTGPADASYQFELCYDKENVYVAVNVIDERVMSEKGKLPWNQDSIEVCIDPRDDPDRAMNRRDYSEPWNTFAYLAFCPAKSADQMSVFEPQKIPGSVNFACVPTAAGYAAEIAIPNAVLNKLRPSGEWRDLRFNIGIHDTDEPGGSNIVLWWQPDWHSDANVAGSGTFRR